MAGPGRRQLARLWSSRRGTVSAAATAACPPPPSLQAPFGANAPFSAGGLHTGSQERGCAAELGSRLGPCVPGRLAALAEGGRGGEAPTVPAAADVLTAGAPTPTASSSAPAREQTSLLTKK